MKFLLKFLPNETRGLLELAIRITAALDTKHERDEAIKYGLKMLQDGKVQVHEWSTFGSKLGIFKLKEKKDVR